MANYDKQYDRTMSDRYGLPELDDLHEDALWDDDEVVSLTELADSEGSECQLSTAGIDTNTSVDKFFELQGDTSFVTSL